jgi:hypothetical protein
VQHPLSLALGLVCAVWSGTSLAQAPNTPPPVAAPDSQASMGATNERVRIVLVVGPDLEELTARFVAELGSMHFDVVRVDGTIVPRVDELEGLALRHSARVAVRVSRANQAVDLWLVYPETHELVFRRVATDGDPAVVVLRSLEILRGSLLDLQTHPVERHAEPPAPESALGTTPHASPPTPRQPLWLGGSAALFGARFGRALAPGAALGLYRGVGSRFALRADVLLSLGDWTVEGEGGSAKIRVGGATVSALVVPWGEGSLTPGLGLGVGALALYTQGEARPGYLGTTELNFAAFPHARLELAVGSLAASGEEASPLGIIGSIRLRFAVVAGFATPRPVLVFAGDSAVDWLNPVWVSSVGVEVALR